MSYPTQCTLPRRNHGMTLYVKIFDREMLLGTLFTTVLINIL